MNAEHLVNPPADSFWVSELGFARFPSLLPLLDDAPGLSEALHTAWAGPTPAQMLGELLDEHGDSPSVQLHLLLVAQYLEGKKSAAVRDVAQALLDPAELQAIGCNGGRVQRLPMAAKLYLRAPSHLVAVDACHRWHSRRRCAMELAGPRRKPPAPVASLDWERIGREALQRLPPTLRAKHRPRFGLAVPRAGGHEVLLAFREPAGYATVYDDGGQAMAGRLSGWTLLRFHRELARVDVTAAHLPLGTALADAVANRVWSADPPLRYRPAEGKLRAEDLQDFLERLRDVEDDSFQLLEINALGTALAERPEIQVGGAGQARAEPALQEIRRHMAFAERWDSVRQVKVGFMDRYRVTVQFPAKGAPLQLTYSDAERDKDACSAFEELFRDELGVRILPLVARRGGKRASTTSRRPNKPGSATWARLLAPVVDNLATWEAELVRGLADEGLVTLSEHSIFRCGDPSINRTAAGGPADSLECPGEVEMPFGVLDPDDPHRQEDDAEFICSSCGRPWYPGRYRLDLGHRMRVRVQHAEAWGLLLEAAGKHGRFDEEGPGVASGMVAGQRTYLVYLPLAPVAWHEPAALGAFRGCWVGVPMDGRLERYGAAGMDLAGHLGDRRELGQRLTRALTGGYPVFPAAVPAMVAAPSVAPRATPAVVPRALPERVVISLDARGVWVGGANVAGSKATGLVGLLALLQAGADEDERTGRERRFRTAEQLRKLATGLSYSKVQTWVSRGRAMLDKRGGVEGLGAMVIEGGEGGGYRLGGRFWCVGFGE